MRWISVITSYLSPILNKINHFLSVDVKVGVDQEDDPAGNCEDENNPYDLEAEEEEEIVLEKDENESVSVPLSFDVKIVVNQDDDSAGNCEDGNNPLGFEEEMVSVSVSLPKNRKVCFYRFYCSFVTMFVVCFFVIAYMYPLKPTCHIDDFYLPAFDEELSATNMTDEMKESVYLLLSINNRNRLISASYDHFNITIYYLPTRNTSIYFANAIAPGFNQHKRLKQTKVIEVHMPAPGLPGLLQLQRPLSEMPFRVNLEFTMRFSCRAPCKHKQRFIRVSALRIHLKNGTRYAEDIVMMN